MPKFWTYDNKELPIDGCYKEQSCFILVGGPSLKDTDLTPLAQPGIVTFGVNNSPRVYRPDLWISVDDPANFMLSIWKDPRIKKFVMHGKRNKLLWDNTKWCDSTLTVADCPNIVYYKDNEHFKASEDYLDEDTINWGNHTDRCECGFFRVKSDDGKKVNVCPACGKREWGSRSVLLAAIKTAYVLGFKNVFLAGADFSMGESKGYAWEQARSDQSIKANNDTYARLNARFTKLRPVFEKRGFYVFNTTPNSNLHSFAKIELNDAVKIALGGFPETKTERTYGMYERRSIDKKVEEGALKVSQLKAELGKEKDARSVKRLQQQLSKTQDKLTTAIEERERIVTWTA